MVLLRLKCFVTLQIRDAYYMFLCDLHNLDKNQDSRDIIN